MSGRYLTDLASVIRSLGLVVHEESGWQSRARSSGGYASGRPTHVMIHHTASAPSADGQPDVNYMTYNSSDRPLANLYINRAGQVWVMAAGATNTNGKGSDSWGGGVPNDSMNTYAIGIEAGNNGVGEPWPTAQQDAYVKLVAGLCAHYGIPVNNVRGHFEWAPTRKIDPAGPSRWASGSASWNMNGFRTSVSNAAPKPPKPPTPPSTGASMFSAFWSYNGTIWAVYTGGYKVWMSSPDVLAAQQALCRISGLDDEVHEQTDRSMWIAFGPALGPKPDGTDAYGA